MNEFRSEDDFFGHTLEKYGLRREDFLIKDSCIYLVGDTSSEIGYVLDDGRCVFSSALNAETLDRRMSDCGSRRAFEELSTRSKQFRSILDSGFDYSADIIPDELVQMARPGEYLDTYYDGPTGPLRVSLRCTEPGADVWTEYNKAKRNGVIGEDVSYVDFQRTGIIVIYSELRGGGVEFMYYAGNGKRIAPENVNGFKPQD